MRRRTVRTPSPSIAAICSSLRPRDSSSSTGRFLARMARGVPSGFGLIFGNKAHTPSREQQVAGAHEVTGDENAWLDAQVHANGEVDEYDRALLAFIAEEVGGR